MSGTPAATAIAAAILLLGLPALAAGAQLEARHRAAGAADAAALAAADAAAGLVAVDPCELAGEVVNAARATLEQCTVDVAAAEARVVVRASTPLGPVEMRARAGPASRP